MKREIPTGEKNRTRSRLIGAVLVTVAIFAAAGMIGSRWSGPERAFAFDSDEEAAIRAARGLGKAFTSVSREVVPSVVTITSNKVIHPANAPDSEEMLQFFRFFGMPRDNDGDIMQRALGSGVIASSDGYIITNNHVVADAKEIAVILSDGEEYEAELIGTDPKSDIAVIRIDATGLPAATLGDSDNLEVGEWVLAIGSPFSQNLNHTVTAGIVSAKSRVAVGLADYEDFIQTDAAINPGNSGGALVDLDGRVVGINSAIASRSGGSQGVGFAIPINMVRRIKDDLIESGTVVRGWIGIGIQPVSKEIQEALGLGDRKGILVSSIMEESPAEDAGLKRQDVILSLDGERIESLRAFRNEVAALGPGVGVDLKISRKGKIREMRVTLGRLPGDEEPPPVAAREAREKLGIEVSGIDRNLRRSLGLDRDEGGVAVTGVRRGSIASQNGIREGDVIVEINQRTIETVADYDRSLGDLEEGEVALFLVEREGSTFFVGMRIPE